MENQIPARRPGRPRKQHNLPPDNSVPVPPDDAPVAASAAPVEALSTPVVERPPLREEMRAEDPREAADRRAAEIFSHLGGDLDNTTDDFYFDPAAIPDGWNYEWKRRTVYNYEDPAYTVSLRRTGWTEVPAKRHPEMMPSGVTDSSIERKGMVLMERPQAVTDRVREIDRLRARNQVRTKEEQLGAAPAGQFERNNKDAPLAKINKGYEAIPIPKG